MLARLTQSHLVLAHDPADGLAPDNARIIRARLGPALLQAGFGCISVHWQPAANQFSDAFKRERGSDRCEDAKAGEEAACWDLPFPLGSRCAS
jgi:hypothetical protein